MSSNSENSLTDDINVWIKQYKETQDPEQKKQLRNIIVLASLPLVKKISHGLARRSSDPVEDLIQVGSMGLLKAIDQFDLNVGANFKTYSSYLITGEIRHYLRDKANMIRAPRELQELSFRINQIIERLTEKLGKSPSDVEIAGELSLSVEKVNEITQIDRRKQTLSLDQVIYSSGDCEQTYSDKLADDKYQEYLRLREDRIMLEEAVNTLSAPLSEVVKLSFFEDLSQNEIAKRLNISQMQVSRRLKKAISELFVIITKRSKRS